MPHTLLLADDSVTIQRVIELTFADEDVKVIAVSDGDQAIERLESSPPDIVLADIGMPGKNGYEVAKYIKQSPKLSHIPVVLLTGAFEPVDQARAAEAGCDGVLAKPFEPQLVIGRVKELLAKSHQAPASGAETMAPPRVPSAVEGPAADTWAASAADQALEPPVTSVGSAPLDDYFDRLDAAFQTISDRPIAPAAPEPVAASSEAAPDLDWFGAPESPAPATERWDFPPPPAETAMTDAAADLPLSSSEPAFESDVEPPPIVPHSDPEMMPFAPPEPAAADAPEPPRVTALPTLADAFAAILASEAHEPASSAAATWPATAAPNDDLVEQVTRRVLDRLSDQVVRDTVSDIVSQIAERLVREEIERIKASIR
jgi:CheY-like chemotaxis protein